MITFASATNGYDPMKRIRNMADMLRSKENIVKKQEAYINELCEIYYRTDFNKQVDIAAFNLLLSLIGVAPLRNIPHSITTSINAFRNISHQERYAFSMVSISSLMESPSTNIFLQDAFERIILCVAPLTDGIGQIVLEDGNLNFGKYKDVPLRSLIFSQRT